MSLVQKNFRLTQSVNCTQNPNGSLNYGSLRRIAPLLDIRTGWPSWGRLLCIIPLLLFTFQPGTQQEQIQYIQTCNRASAFLSTIALSCQRDCVHVITTHLLQSSLTWFIKKTLNHDLTSLHIWAKSLSYPCSIPCLWLLNLQYIQREVHQQWWITIQRDVHQQWWITISSVTPWTLISIRPLSNPEQTSTNPLPRSLCNT